MSPSLLLATATVAPLASWDAVVVGAAVAAVPDPSSSPPPQAVRARVRAARSAALANTFLMAKPPGVLAGPTGRREHAQMDNLPPLPMVPRAWFPWELAGVAPGCHATFL